MDETATRPGWALVTGASDGIGLGIARALRAAGHHIVAIARQPERLAVAAAWLEAEESSEREILTRPVDVTDAAAMDELFDWLADAIPALDVCVANAGTGSMASVPELDDDSLRRIFSLNVDAVVGTVRRASRLMIARPAPNQSILVVSSIRALRAGPGRAAYSSSKAAANQFVRVAALDLAPHGIRVNTLSPGITDTPLARSNPSAFAEAESQVPLGRAGTVAEMGAAAAFLVGPQARFITGANLVVDGGESLG